MSPESRGWGGIFKNQRAVLKFDSQYPLIFKTIETFLANMRFNVKIFYRQSGWALSRSIKFV